jgi:putative ABC transport system permease protein
MLPQILSILFRRKRQSALLIIQLFFSLIITFTLSSLVIFNYVNYHKARSVETDDILLIEINYSNDTIRNLDLIRQELSQNRAIENFAITSENQPFSKYMILQYVKYNDLGMTTQIIKADPAYASIMDLDILEGEMFTVDRSSDDVAVITKGLKEHWFGNESPIGKYLEIGSDRNQRVKIIGVVDNYKHVDDFTPLEYGLIKPPSQSDFINKILVKSAVGLNSQLEREILSGMTKANKGWSYEIQTLEEVRMNKNLFITIPVLVVLTVGLFFIINVILGTFGLLISNINKRKREIGIRRSVGARKIQVIMQFIMEMIIITSVAVFFGLILMVQFPIFKVFDVPKNIYVVAIVVSVSSIYTIVLLCSYFPSRQAGQIQPTIALRND